MNIGLSGDASLIEDPSPFRICVPVVLASVLGFWAGERLEYLPPITKPLVKIGESGDASLIKDSSSFRVRHPVLLVPVLCSGRVEADQPAGPPQLLDARAVARLLSVPRKRLYEMHESGELRGVRIGARSLRWPARALELWIQGRSTSCEG